MKRIIPVAIMALALLLPAAASAHHSYGMFDVGKVATLTGTVRQFAWVNPHAHLILDVADSNGAVKTWDLEMSPPGGLVRKGWKRTSIKTGDKVTVEITPLRENLPGGHLSAVTTASGEKLLDGLPRATAEPSAAN